MKWKFVILCGLLLAVAPRARAVDPPPPGGSTAAPTQEVDPEDLNGDGVVTNKEKRQKRRADRRARRRAKAGSGQSGGSDDAQDGDAAQDADATAESSDRGSNASANASKAAEALKSSLPSADAGGALGGGAGGTGGAGGPAGGPGGGAGAGSGGTGSGAGGQIGGTSGSNTRPETFHAGTGSGGPANPKTPGDFALAARSPYAPAFAATGLKLGPDGKTVFRLDGTPATADDYARLQRAISSMPEALGRRPDFFSAISPEHYSDLKRGIKDEKHAGTVYKDVGTTPGDRDFVHTASCDKLSGECNKNVDKASYKKGDFVAPEDLDAMWSALQKELDGSASKDDAREGSGMPSLGAKRSPIAEDAAMDTALGVSNQLSGEKAPSAGPAGTAVEAKAGGTVAGAAVSVKRLWKTVAMGLPGADGRAKSGTGLMLIIGAAAAVLAFAGVVIVRRKG